MKIFSVHKLTKKINLCFTLTYGFYGTPSKNEIFGRNNFFAENK